jgi:predicted Holliday junction resolvase-like endonuclease
MRLKKEKHSMSIRFGMAAEQLLPFIKKYNPEKFRFIGSPVDGIHFDENEIIFVEFKTGNSQLNENEKRIKELIEKKKVRFEIIRINN